MIDTLGIVAPIFLLIGLGFTAVRLGWFAGAGLQALGGFVIRFSLPALLFNALAKRQIGEVLNLRFLAVYALGSLLTLALGLAWARWVRREGLTASAIAAMGMCCSNTAFVGYPVMLQVIGPEASVALALAMVVENLLMIPLCLALADTGAQAGHGFVRAFGKALAGLPRNPIIVAIALGIVFASLQWKAPAPLARAIDLMASSAGAAALFYVGGMLAGLSLRQVAADALAVGAMLLALGPVALIGGHLAAAALLMAAAPMLGVYAIFGQKHGQQQACAARMLVATTASFVTLMGWIAVVHRLGLVA
jgi:hypothetical protein